MTSGWLSFLFPKCSARCTAHFCSCEASGRRPERENIQSAPALTEGERKEKQRKKKVWEEQLEPLIHRRLSAVFAVILTKAIASLRYSEHLTMRSGSSAVFSLCQVSTPFDWFSPSPEMKAAYVCLTLMTP